MQAMQDYEIMHALMIGPDPDQLHTFENNSIMALVPPLGGDVAGAGPEPAAAPAGPPRNGLQAIVEVRVFHAVVSLN